MRIVKTTPYRLAETNLTRRQPDVYLLTEPLSEAPDAVRRAVQKYLQPAVADPVLFVSLTMVSPSGSSYGSSPKPQDCIDHAYISSASNPNIKSYLPPNVYPHLAMLYRNDIEEAVSIDQLQSREPQQSQQPANEFEGLPAFAEQKETTMKRIATNKYNQAVKKAQVAPNGAFFNPEERRPAAIWSEYYLYEGGQLRKHGGGEAPPVMHHVAKAMGLAPSESNPNGTDFEIELDLTAEMDMNGNPEDIQIASAELHLDSGVVPVSQDLHQIILQALMPELQAEVEFTSPEERDDLRRYDR